MQMDADSMLDFLEVTPRRSHNENYEGNRRLVGSIIAQAYNDALSGMRANDFEGARRFLTKNNPLFIHYCELIDLNPEWYAKKIRKRLNEKLDIHLNEDE